MSTRRTEEDILTAKRSPQVGVMHQIIKKVKAPLQKAILDIQLNRVRKNGTLDEAREVQAKVSEILINELSSTVEDGINVYTQGSDIPAEGNCYIINAVGSTINLSMGSSDICLSLGYVKDGEMECAVFYFPVTEKLYITERGQGIDGPDMKLRIAGKESTENMVVSFFSPISRTENEDEVQELYTKLRKLGCHIRMGGNTIADVITCATGGYDVFIGENLAELDVFFAEMIIREAGGFTCETKGKKVELGSTSFMASNHKLQGKLLKALSS